MRRIVSFHLRYWPVVLLLVCALAAISVPRTITLFKTISTDPIDLLPKSNPNVLTLLKVRDKIERGTRSNIVIESDDRDANIRFMKDTVKKLEALPYIARVEWKKTGYDFFNKHKLLFMEKKDLESIRDRIDKKIQKEKLVGLYFDLEESEDEQMSFGDLEEKYTSKYNKDITSEYSESPDGRIFSIFLESPPGDTSIAAAGVFHDSLTAFTKTLEPTKFHPTMKVYLNGATKVIEYRTLLSDLTKVGIISLLLIFIPLLIRFRNPLYVLVIFLPLFLGLPISFAVSAQIVPKLNICTSFLFAILGGLGIENGIHIFSRYVESRKRGLGIETSLEEIYTKTGRAILTSVGAVAITFLAMAWNEFKGFSEFGLIAGIGLVVIFFVYFIFMPSLMIAAEKISLLRFTAQDEVTEFKTSMLRIPTGWVLTIGILLTIFSGVVSPMLTFEYDSKATRADIKEVQESRAKQRQTVKRVNNPAVIMIENKDEADRFKALIDKQVAAGSTTTVDAARSYYDLFPPEQEAKMKVVGQISKLLKDKSLKLIKKKDRKDLDRFRLAVNETDLVTKENLPADLSYVFKGKPNTAGELMFINAMPTLELDDGQNAMKFADDVSVMKVDSKTYYPSSDAVVYGLILKTMLADAPRVIILSLLCIVFFVFLDFRKISTTLLVVTPILLGVLWMLGVMWISDMRFNFFNMIIIPAVLGMSVDNSIHIYHRYKELGPGSMSTVLSSSGMASLLASLTNASAFIGLLFCSHKGLFSIGQLAVVGVATCLLSTLVFFPAFLEFLEKKTALKELSTPKQI